MSAPASEARAMGDGDRAAHAIAAAGSGWRHALRHGDRLGLLSLYAHALAARILVGDRSVEEARAPVLAERLIVCRLAEGRPPPAGLWPIQADGRRRFQALDGRFKLADLALIWPVLAPPEDLATVPDCIDLLAMDRQDPALWRLATGAAEILHCGPAHALERAAGGDRPVRLHRHPSAWLAAVQEGYAADGDKPLPLCILDPRGRESERLLAGAASLACDDLEHAEQVTRWQRELLAQPKRPPVLVPAGAGEEEGAAA